MAYNIDGDPGNQWGWDTASWSSMAPGRFFTFEEASDDELEPDIEIEDVTEKNLKT